ncbi:DEAD/DEAH box helicase [Basilea psittacipulmonis]|uniref:DEAD/DEAH box helicase n=1 Tax=Basilea psittacipulmonis DSM 24701 TaxID=1072685 RepID=A0A077DHY6_9BURK|nr:DEAD/DEAH box helicase [Basilea psittacipulmonis]AIL32723.1 DEAD/DEAH box helicase [Basilea psittacipulmonis DSM 24701]
MTITQESLEKLNTHWAIQAISENERKEAFNLANKLMVNNAVGSQFNLELSSINFDLLERIALAYEVAAIEHLNALLNPTSNDTELREQCIAASHQAFEFYRLLPIPTQQEQKIFHTLHLACLAYCGQRSVDLYRWLNENKDKIVISTSSDATWDIKILHTLYRCWLRLFQHNDWQSINEIIHFVNELRTSQKAYEADFFNHGSVAENQAKALHLVSLYHWAKATDIQANYLLKGEPITVAQLLDKHFESAIEAAFNYSDMQLEMLLRWMQVASRQMVETSIWWVARRINSRVTKFINHVTKSNALFELIPPQKTAIQEQGLLDVAATAIVVDMPTSGGKTLLAQFRILQALNQFAESEDGCWIAYIAPTKALVSQITRRLRKDFEPIGVKVEQLTGSIDIDTFEEALLTQENGQKSFDILVATPEKLQLIIRNKKVPRPLVLVVMDEAHNIEDEQRGLRIELLLATIKAECDKANFLLLMPFVEKAETIARWLAHDRHAGRAISLGTTAWKPNEQMVGIFRPINEHDEKSSWRLEYETLTTTRNTIHLKGKHYVGGINPLNINKRQCNLSLQAVAMAKIMSVRGTSIAIATRINDVWNMARTAAKNMPLLHPIPDEIVLVQKFIQAEIGENFELIDMLSRGIGVHHAGLSDEIRTLMEWLAEEGKLKILCATTTIAQGINFPVSSVFLASRYLPSKKYCKEMSTRDFWNLAGRAGRMNHESVGIVGIAAGQHPDKTINFVKNKTGELVSRLIQMLEKLEEVGQLNELNKKIYLPDWEDFRCYVAHLWNEKKNLDLVLAETEQLLRNTLGYGVLESDSKNKQKAQKLLDVTRQYAQSLNEKIKFVTLADMTGFSPEGISKAITGFNQLEQKLTINDWKPDSLFGEHSGMSELYGIMLKVPQLKNLENIASDGTKHTLIADITKAWVSGQRIEDIAKAYFQDSDKTTSISNTCKAIYQKLINNGTWGFSALSKLGLDFDNLSQEEKRHINLLPAMIYHGVKTEEAVLMRMNALPRSIAESFGEILKDCVSSTEYSVQQTRQFLKNADTSQWNQASKNYANILSGQEYKKIWNILSGES